MDGSKRVYNSNPYETTNLFSKLFLCWIAPLLALGYKKTLVEEDLFEPVHYEKAKCLTEKLEKEWNKVANKKGASLMGVVTRLYFWKIFFFSLAPFFQEAFRMLSPLLIAHLIKYFNGQIDLNEVLVYGTVLLIGSAISSMMSHPYFFQISRYGMQIRLAVGGLIYKKMLRLRSTNDSQSSSGKILNLLSNDATRIEGSLIFIAYCLFGPFQAVAIVVLLIKTVDFSVLAGLPVLLLMIPLQIFLGHVMTHYKIKTAKVTDERINMTSEVLNGIKIIKMYCWEEPFKKIIEKIRKRELNTQSLVFLFSALNYLIGIDLIPVYSYVSIAVFTHVTNTPLLPSHIIFVLSYYVRFTISINTFLVRGITGVLSAQVSFKRIQEFLLQPEINEIERNKSNHTKEIRVESMYAGWTLRTDTNSDKDGCFLKDISFEVKPNKLLAVVGHVGSGKSSLLMALLGEMPNIHGNVNMSGSVFYVSQEPWIFSATVKQNILFGEPYDKMKFNEIVKICALKEDMKMFANGENTIIGDKGVNLSGGQRARISLARALYNDPDIYLLDDPLSAVDANVAKHLFDKCINGYLKSKIRILVTHQVHHLTSADQIVILNNGSMVGKGTYDELINDSNLSALLSSLKQEESQKTESVTQTRDIESQVEKFVRQRSIISEGECDNISNMTYSQIITDTSETEKQKEMYEEKHTKGSISFSVYTSALNPCLTILSFVTVAFLFASSQVMRNGIDFWISDWANMEEKKYLAFQHHKDLRHKCDNLTMDFNESDYSGLCSNLTIAHNATYLFQGREKYFLIYTVLTGVTIFSVILRSLAFFLFFYIIIKKLHLKLLSSIVHARIRFFDVNPLGRIMNRFSKDLGILDDILPMTLFDFLVCLMATLGMLLVPVIINYWLLIPLVPLTIIFAYLRKYFMQTSRELKRIEGLCRSPIYSHTANTIYGIPTIRACNNQTVLYEDFLNHCDYHTQAFFASIAVNRWFAVRLDLIVTVYTFIIVYGCIFLKDYLPLTPGIVGIALISLFNIVSVFQWCVRQSAEVENLLTSVERIVEYSTLKGEDLHKSKTKPPGDWPENGEIVFDNVSFAYDDNLPDVLKNVSLKIKSKEKIGIVGRTGAGKSTIFQTLFRMAEPSGAVYIDGVNIKEISLHDLRNKIAIIPQEPTLFIGTLRYNLDPFCVYDDKVLWDTLETVQLKETVKNMKDGLNTEIQRNGSNLSVGQKQLICLARAILTKSKILIIDEATANVDYHTDALIQKAIRECFRDCTVITIAHRLQTIMDSDKILCLSNGILINSGHPFELLNDKTSILYDMIKKLDQNEAEHLHDIARKSYLAKNEKNNDTSNSTLQANTTKNSDSLNDNSDNDVDDETQRKLL